MILSALCAELLQACVVAELILALCHTVVPEQPGLKLAFSLY